MNTLYSQKDIERGYLKNRRLKPSSFLRLITSVDVPQLLNYLGLMWAREYKRSSFTWKEQTVTLDNHRSVNIHWEKEYYIRCPFHQERTPSCAIHPSKGYFYCYGCHHTWDLVKFVAEIEWKGNIHAIWTLRKISGITWLEYETELTPIEEVFEKAQDRVYFLLENASKYKPKNPESGWIFMSESEYITELSQEWVLDEYLRDYLKNNKLEQLHSVSQIWISDKKSSRSPESYKFLREFYNYVDSRRQWEDWEHFLYQNYDEDYLD